VPGVAGHALLGEHLDQVPVGEDVVEDPFDRGVGQRPPVLPGHRLDEPSDLGDQVLDEPLLHRAEQRVLGVEIQVEGPLGHARGLGHVRDRGARDAPLGEGAPGRGQELLPPLDGSLDRRPSPVRRRAPR
jgi:hypothetical protein